jgi:hypothetical protein
MSFAIDTFDPERFGLVTGSKCSVLFPLRGDGAKGQKTYAKQLAKELHFKTYDEVSTWQMEHGKMAEPVAFEHYNERIDNRIEKGYWIRKGNCGGTIDAIIPGVRGIDFKAPTTLQAWLDYFLDGMDKEQECQCRMYMYLTDLPEWEIAAYLLETEKMTNSGLKYPVPEEQRMTRIVVKRNTEWERALEVLVPAVIEVRDEYVEILRSRFKRIAA